MVATVGISLKDGLTLPSWLARPLSIADSGDDGELASPRRRSTAVCCGRSAVRNEAVVRVDLATHDAGGITTLDVALAHSMEELAARQPTK